jgi:hypothetical protein
MLREGEDTEINRTKKLRKWLDKPYKERKKIAKT